MVLDKAFMVIADPSDVEKIMQRAKTAACGAAHLCITKARRSRLELRLFFKPATPSRLALAKCFSGCIGRLELRALASK